MLMTFIEEATYVATQYPEPKMQVRNLLDLPPELLHRIMEVAGVEGARQLGSACKLLRDVSRPYIYQVRPYSTHDSAG